MNVKIVDVFENLEQRYRVVAEINGNEFIAEWNSLKPERNKLYDVEIDIDDEFKWNMNINISDEKIYLITNDNKGIKIIAKLDYNYKENLSYLSIYDSIVLIDLCGLNRDALGEWVKIQCDSIKLFNTNL